MLRIYFGDKKLKEENKQLKQTDDMSYFKTKYILVDENNPVEIKEVLNQLKLCTICQVVDDDKTDKTEDLIKKI